MWTDSPRPNVASFLSGKILAEILPAPESCAFPDFARNWVAGRRGMGSENNEGTAFLSCAILPFPLQSHERVSLKLHHKFAAWVDSFVEENVTEEAKEECDKWLMGLAEDNKPCETTRHTDNDTCKAPYYTYNKYSVKYDKLPPALTVATATLPSSKSSSRPSSTTPQQQSSSD